MTLLVSLVLVTYNTYSGTLKIALCLGTKHKSGALRALTSWWQLKPKFRHVISTHKGTTIQSKLCQLKISVCYSYGLSVVAQFF